MAGTLADSFVEVKPDTRNFESHLKRNLRGINTAPMGEVAGGNYSRGFGTGLRRLGGIGMAAVGGITTALGAAAAAAGGLGLKTAMANEAAQISFTTMLKSGDKAKVFLDELKAFAAATPFEFGGLQTAASSLISIGIATDKVIPIMTTLGDVTAGMGTGSEGIKRATVALQQMNAAGKITAEDLNQLRDAGIPVFDLLTAATGKTKAEIADMSKKGKLGSDVLKQLMTALETGKGLERFNGLMDEQSRSIGGLWSTLKDTFSQGMAAAIQPAVPLIKQGLGGAIAFVTAKLPAFVAGVGKMVSGMVGLYDLLVKGDYTGKLREAFGWEEDSSMVDMLLRVRAGAQGLYDLIVKGDYTGKLREAFGWEEDSDAVDMILDLRDAWTGLMDKLGGGNSTDTWSKVSNAVTILATGIGDLLTKLPALEPTVSALSTVMGFLWEHIDKLGVAMPYLIAAFVAYQASQAASRTIGQQSILGFALQITSTVALAASQFALASALRSSTTAQGAQLVATNMASASMQRGVISTLAHKVATLASSAAHKAAAATTAAYAFVTNALSVSNLRAAAGAVAHGVAVVASTVAQKAAMAATKAWIAIQWLMNAALTANPIGLVIAAIALLVGGIILAYQKSETFRTIVDAAFKGVAKTATWLWEEVIRPAFKAWIGLWLTVVDALLTGAEKAFGWVPGIGDKLRDAKKQFDTFKKGVNSALDGINDKDITVEAKFRATYGLQAGGATLTSENFARRRGLKRGGAVPHLPGSTPREDSVAASLVPGEFVVREDGSNLYDAIRYYASKKGWRGEPEEERRQGYKDGGVVVKPKYPNSAVLHEMAAEMMAKHVAPDAAAPLAYLAQQRLDKEMRAMAATSGYGAGVGHALSRVRQVLLSGLTITSTYRTPARNAAVGGARNSLHMDKNNPAVDIGGPTYLLDRMNAILRSMGGWRQLLWRVAGHYDHLHVADTGGMINSGSLGLNLSGRPERILSPDQTAAFERLVANLERGGGDGGRTLVIVDKDGDLIGRMRVEASDVLDEELADARWGGGF